MNEPVIIYTEKFSNRLSYVSELLLGSLIGLPYQLTTDKNYFNESAAPKINYSFENFDDAVTIHPAGLMTESGIRNIDPVYRLWGTQPVLFLTNENSSFPFDIFSAAFFMVTRYEEYLPFKADEHGRFSSDQSVAGKNNFVDEPVVQQWAQLLFKALQKESPYITPRQQRFSMEVTIDVDVAYAFLYRNISRFSFATARDLISLRLKSFANRLLVSAKTKSDPFNTYNYIEQIHMNYDLSVNIFYLAGDYGHYDRNIPVKEPAIKALIADLGYKFDLGLHPSYRAADNFDILKDELERLSVYSGCQITRSRQHFLRLTFPRTYHWLMKLGITHDYSMGYHDKPGFRAGIAAPYFFYDLLTETKTNLTIHPFAYMERTLKDRLKLDPDMALLKIVDLMKKVNAVNGTFGSIWHNDSLSNYGEWKRWRYVYEVMLSMGYTMSRKKEITKKVAQLSKQ